MFHLNLDLILRRAIGRATCVKRPTTRLAASARILNVVGITDRIRIGAHTMVRGELMTQGHGGRIEIGDWCYIGANTRIWSSDAVTIGDRVLISHDVNVFDNITHPIDPAARHAHFRDIILRGHPRTLDIAAAPVVIEDDAWLGAGVSVLKGVRIGAGAIVATRSVVTHDVPAHCIVAGNPAQIVRRIGAEDADHPERPDAANWI